MKKARQQTPHTVWFYRREVQRLRFGSQVKKWSSSAGLTAWEEAQESSLGYWCGLYPNLRGGYLGVYVGKHSSSCTLSLGVCYVSIKQDQPRRPSLTSSGWWGRKLSSVEIHWPSRRWWCYVSPSQLSAEEYLVPFLLEDPQLRSVP